MDKQEVAVKVVKSLADIYRDSPLVEEMSEIDEVAYKFISDNFGWDERKKYRELYESLKFGSPDETLWK